MPPANRVDDDRRMGWTIRHDGTDFEVETGDEPRTTRLLADGSEVDAQTTGYWESSTLSHADTTIEVRWGPRNTITSCHLLAPEEADEPAKIPLAPPPGSKAAKREAFQRDHPTAYVVRRTAWAGVEILVGVLGIGALVSAFFGSTAPPRVPAIATGLATGDLQA